MRFWQTISGIILGAAALCLPGCSSENSESQVSGIEIGNPALALTADFSIDYSDKKTQVLAKAGEELVLLDTFSLVLTQLRSYSSYYVSVSVDPILGFQLWPYETAPDETLAISFSEHSAVEEAFSEIDLQEEGLLKEIGVFFVPGGKDRSQISGRLLIDGEYIPFEYDLSYFQLLSLRYHYSQIDKVEEHKANLSVVFHVRNFVDGLDLQKAEISDDGVIYFNACENAALWDSLNVRFVPSFEPLRYDYVTNAQDTLSAYVENVWEDVALEKGVNTVSNGDFSDGSVDWILMNQFSGVGDTSIIKENATDRIMKVSIQEAGRYSYSVQLIHENIPLVKGKRHMCVFTIWADSATEITARLGSYTTYETVGFQEHVNVQTTGHSFEIEFTPDINTPFARFELNLGKNKRTFYIKEVKIYRLE